MIKYYLCEIKLLKSQVRFPAWLQQDKLIISEFLCFLSNWAIRYINFLREKQFNWNLCFNRYRRGLETCPQAKTSKSGREYFLLFFRRVRATSMTQRRVENTRVHFWTFSPVSVKSKKMIEYFELLESEKSEIPLNLSKQIIRTQTIDMDTDDELETTSFQVKVILFKNH